MLTTSKLKQKYCSNLLYCKNKKNGQICLFVWFVLLVTLLVTQTNQITTTNIIISILLPLISLLNCNIAKNRTTIKQNSRKKESNKHNKNIIIINSTAKTTKPTLSQLKKTKKPIRGENFNLINGRRNSLFSSSCVLFFFLSKRIYFKVSACWHWHNKIKRKKTCFLVFNVLFYNIL